MRGKGSPEPQHTQKGVQIEIRELFDYFCGCLLTLFGTVDATASSFINRRSAGELE